MKNVRILLLAVLSIFFVNSISAQTAKSKTKSKKVMSAAKYQCPMKCEGDKVYKKAGKCPECGMALKKVAAVKKETKVKVQG